MTQPELLPSLPLKGSKPQRAFAIGLGFGLMALLVIGLVMGSRLFFKDSPALADLVNTLINLVPLWAAAAGAYLAPEKKMASGVISGAVSLLPPLVIALLALGMFTPLMLLPLLVALAVMGVYIVVGALMGIGLARWRAKWLSRSPRPRL